MTTNNTDDPGGCTFPSKLNNGTESFDHDPEKRRGAGHAQDRVGPAEILLMDSHEIRILSSQGDFYRMFPMLVCSAVNTRSDFCHNTHGTDA